MSRMKLSWQNYYLECYPVFDICANTKVLEIGPLNGIHTPIILDKKPKSLTLVEYNEECYKQLLNTFPNCEIVYDDIFNYLNQTRDFDTVVCCGVLYHLHHPFWLLELIANKINPKNIILETYHHNLPPFIGEEEDNDVGNRQIKNWKSCKMHIRPKTKSFITAMNNLDYTLKSQNMIEKPCSDTDSSIVSLMTFEKI